MQCLHEVVADSSLERPTLSDAAQLMVSRGRYLAFHLQGHRYNIGYQYGVLIAQLAIGLSGQDRDFLLTELVELDLSHNQVRGQVPLGVLLNDHNLDVDFGLVYGSEFSFLNDLSPNSIMLAEGSEITVESKKVLSL